MKTWMLLGMLTLAGAAQAAAPKKADDPAAKDAPTGAAVWLAFGLRGATSGAIVSWAAWACMRTPVASRPLCSLSRVRTVVSRNTALPDRATAGGPTRA